MYIDVIASSSKGNGYLISDGKTAILIECGLSMNELKRRTNFIVPRRIDGCLVTHSHQDHSKALKDMLNLGVDCYALKETFEANEIAHHRAYFVEDKKEIKIGTFKIIPLEMYHDVPCVGFLIYSKMTNEKLLFATDTYMIKYAIKGLDYIMIEANYDVELVEDNGQRERLIKSHMSIETTINYLKSIDYRMSNRYILCIYLQDIQMKKNLKERYKLQRVFLLWFVKNEETKDERLDRK